MTQKSISREARRGGRLRLWRDLGLLLVMRPHRLVAIGWWYLLGKRLRARYRFESAMAALPVAHALWMYDSGKQDLADLAAAGVERAPIAVHLHVAAGDPPDAVRRAAASVRRQSLTRLQIFVTREDGTHPLPFALGRGATVLPGSHATRMGGLHAALEAAGAAGAALLVPLVAGSLLPRHALAGYAAHLLRRQDDGTRPVLLYGDEQDHSASWRGADPWFKPEWDPRMIWSQDYVSQACALPVEASLAAWGSSASVYEQVLRLGRDTPSMRVEHVLRITAETEPGSWRSEATARLAAVQRCAPGQVEAAPGPFATVRLQYPLPEPVPLVSVIVATRDRVNLLRTCVEGVLTGTDYPNLELIIADNDSRDPETLRYMDEKSQDPRVQLVRWPHPFNYSAINNHAARFASGAYLCLLNNDIEVIEPQWLSELVREAAQPGVGAVGARLLYPDRSIQHAGVAIGIGNAAGHAHRALPEGEPGYFAQSLIARGASAVTGACLLVAKEHFDAVGGLDEERLAVAYNDVDLCLKLRARGLANIYTPAATLLHHESKSRGQDFAPEQVERYMRELATFQARWKTDEVVDPWHHPRLDRASEVYRA